MSGMTTLLPFQPDEMSPAQLAAVSFLARYSGHTHQLYAFQLRRQPFCMAPSVLLKLGLTDLPPLQT